MPPFSQASLQQPMHPNKEGEVVVVDQVEEFVYPVACNLMINSLKQRAKHRFPSVPKTTKQGVLENS